MLAQHLFTTSALATLTTRSSLGPPRVVAPGLVHLPGMETVDHTSAPAHDPLDRVLSLSELAARLKVSVQTLYDLRSQGRGPRGFRIGRELRFRAAEVDAWLARLEEADAERHPPVARS